MWITTSENNHTTYQEPNLYSMDGFRLITLEKDAGKITKLKLKTNMDAVVTANIKTLAETKNELDHQVLIKNDEIEIDASCANVADYLYIMREHMKSRSAQAIVKSIYQSFSLTVTPLPLPSPSINKASPWNITKDGVIYNTDMLQIILTKDTNKTPKILTLAYLAETNSEKFSQLIAPILNKAKQNEELAYQQARENPSAAVSVSFPLVHLLVESKHFDAYLQEVAHIIGKENAQVFKELCQPLPKQKPAAPGINNNLTAPGKLGLTPPPAKAAAKQAKAIAQSNTNTNTNTRRKKK